MALKENEIRPESIFNEYLSLTQNDIVQYFSKAPTNDIDCVVCGSNGVPWVNKLGFNYRRCLNCHSIFVSPRPERSAFDSYYTDSLSTKFWATTFYKETENVRREKLWKPKAELIKQRILKFQEENYIKLVIDIGGGYGVFDEELKNIMDIDVLVIEPSVHLAKICREKGLKVIEKFMEDLLPDDLPSATKCFVSFELFEHLYDPKIFLQTVFNSMNKGDLFIFTTLSGTGIDIQILKEHSKSLSPPHHLNFLNPKSASKLLADVGFEVLEAITPGKLDIDILINNKQNIKDEFWKNSLEYLSVEELENFQNFISQSGLSSHMMISSRKP